jgi:hypothetical protein
MKLRINSYELTKLDGNYDKVVEALRTGSMMHCKTENSDQFYMPGGVALELVTNNGKTYLTVHRTAIKEPKYVKNIVQKLGGQWRGSCSGIFRPDLTLDLLLK